MNDQLNRIPRAFLSAILAVCAFLSCPAVPAGAADADRIVVLTFDDAVKSHRTFVAPLLRELGFGATFFITYNWMDDPEHFLTWKEVGEIHEMGFEIGNHTWTHTGLSTPAAAARLQSELALVDYELSRAGVPKPVSFAWPGNHFGPEAARVLRDWGIRLARRGMQPERPYGEIALGPLYNPQRHHPLLIPTAGDAYPDWTLEHFKTVVDRAAGENGICVLQFHGVPDAAHPWVHTPPERFREYMDYLKEGGFKVIAMRDLEAMVPTPPPNDPLLGEPWPAREGEGASVSAEVRATRANAAFWIGNAMRRHGFGWEETAKVFGLPAHELALRYVGAIPEAIDPPGDRLTVPPYPGGRHPRAGFLDGAVNPLRGTKASVFLPWEDAEGYALIDLPEAIWSQLGLTFLAHTHIPTIWDAQKTWIENRDWSMDEDGNLENRWELPNGIAFGASIRPEADHVAMEMWLRNGTEQPLSGLLTQICVMLRGAPGFGAQTNGNKLYENPTAAVRSEDGRRWILTAWERCERPWGNPDCPCMHADPKFPDCPPGETVRLRGALWFYEGEDGARETREGWKRWLETP